MSIRAHIISLEKAGNLQRYTLLSRHPAKRRLYLTVEGVKDLVSPNSVINVLALRGLVEGELRRWVQGGRVYVDLEGNPRFLKRLTPPPPEIWELRFTDPRVQVRLFCRFAEPDTLIGTKFHTRQMLGRKGSANWRNAMYACEKSWKNLFPANDPMSRKTISEYVTENCDDFPI